MGLPHWVISLGLVSVAILDPDHIPAVAPVAIWSQY